VVDNGDGGPEIEEAQCMSFVQVLRRAKIFASPAAAVSELVVPRGAALVFLNPDTFVAPGAIQALVARLDDPAVGITTARLGQQRAPRNGARVGRPLWRAG
jgi:hypothetical protein